MSLFCIFLSSILASLIYYERYILGLVILVFDIYLILVHLKNNKKVLAVILFSFILTILLCLIKDSVSLSSPYFLIIERKKSYIVAFNGLEKIYVRVDKESTFDFLDIIKIEGIKTKINFVTLESSFDFNEYLFSKGIDYEIDAKSVEYIFNFPLNNYFLKERFLTNFEDEVVKNLIGGILFSTIDYSNESTIILKDLQIINLFSITGMYINFSLYGLKRLFFLKFNEKTSHILALITYSPLLILTINKFSIFRALIFYIFNFINKFYLDYKFKKLDSLAILGLFFIAINPRIIFQAGFYMSYMISIFLFLIKVRIKDFNKLEKAFINQLIISVVLFPFLIKFNNSFNVLSTIFIFLLTPLTKIFYLFSLFSFLGVPSIVVNDIFVLVKNIIYLFSDINLTIHIPYFNDLLLCFYFFILYGFFYFVEVNNKARFIPYILTFSLFLSLYTLPIENSFSVLVSFINVGQGDSTLIRIKNKSYLIDTGGLTYTDLATNSLIPYLKKNRIYSLDSVFISHYDFDHYGALESLNSNFKINNIYDYNNFKEFNDSSINIRNLNNSSFSLDENDNSLVLYLSLSSYNFLFMGDASINIEKNIMNEYKDLKVDCLKVGHHGSKTSTSSEFIEFLKPKEAIISCGVNNFYNHPSDEVIATLNKYNVKIRRTDLEGTITYKFYEF